jgi:hypothetical protein
LALAKGKSPFKSISRILEEAVLQSMRAEFGELPQSEMTKAGQGL